jgi:glyoxylase-like metal-dependent hydrolase (beta-lactamase superfamily II)
MGITLKGVNLGYMNLDKSLLVEKPEAQNVPYQCPAIAYIIEHPDGRILWETGISARGKEEWLAVWQDLVDLTPAPPEVCLENRLKELALGPEDFRWVVMGHLHTDHAVGLRIFQDANVDIVVHEDEYNHVRNMQEDSENFFAKVDFAFLYDQKPTTVSGDSTELARDVRLVSLPGHTPGQMGLLVRLEATGWVLLTSDALYMHESYGPPAVGSPIVWESDIWRGSVEKIRRLAIENAAFIFPGHDTTGIKQFADRSEMRTIEFWPGYEYE